MVGAVALIVALIAYRQWFVRINSWAVSVLVWTGRFLLDVKTCRVAETFCVEAAVLWFVFPILDSIYDPNKQRIAPLLKQAYLVAGMFFIFAVILSHAGKED